MATLILVLIYLAFISLGIPDPLLGSAWPAMQPDLNASFGFAGVLSMVIAGGTIVSSLASGTLIGRIGTGRITLISCCMTAGALLGFSVAPSVIWLILLAIPLGLGGGAIDAALNHYVAENYKAHHMNWLHCFWGVGATIGPIIISFFISEQHSWRSGYSAVSMIQFSLAVILLVTLPLWKKAAESRRDVSREDVAAEDAQSAAEGTKVKLFQIKGVKPTLAAFLFYCGVEATVGLWGASYLVGERGITAEKAAGWISLYYGGITAGRFITGFIAMKIHNRVLIRWGQIIAIVGGLLLLLPVTGIYLAGLILIGLGLAPIYPGLIHETPARFGRENSAKLIGYQMATAYTGITILPPLFGVIAGQTSIVIFPFIVIAFLVIMLASVEKVNSLLKPQQRNSSQ